MLDDVDTCLDAKATATLRALLRRPPANDDTLGVIGTAADPAAACGPLAEIFDEVLVVPALREGEAATALAASGLVEPGACAALAEGVGAVPVKALLRVAERAAAASRDADELRELFRDYFADWTAAEDLRRAACAVS